MIARSFFIGLVFTFPVASEAFAGMPAQEFPTARVSSKGSIALKIVPPAGFKLNAGAPNRLVLESHSSTKPLMVLNSSSLVKPRADLGALPRTDSEWRISGKLFICGIQDSAICMTLKVGQLLIPDSASAVRTLEWKLTLPAAAGTSPGASSVR